MVESWQNFYEWHDPVIFSVGSFALRWYGLMYVSALLIGYMWGKRVLRHFPITADQYERLFLWFVIGAVVGARLGYVLVYDTHTLYLLSHPWEIFSPFSNGEFAGISGLSYHGAIAGVIVALIIFASREKLAVWLLLDIAAVAGSAGYALGRVGNFLNAELLGRATDVFWGVRIDGVLRHPSALYEAFLEGIVVWIVLLLLYKRRRFNAQMALTYAMLYTAMRFIAEFWREPDSQIGFLALGLTMGQTLSALMFAAALAVYLYVQKRSRAAV
ncbi:prolipoprotein diacylglyceryl transferase [Campylobacterota bacterium]|nr:prolipoprotein diacylglyceryl transferase [Campylobacterota bacterium]